MSSLSKTIGIMQTSVLQRMSASIGKPACGQPPCQHHRRHAWRMRPACAADNAETPASRRELLLHGTAVTAALAVHALTARLARAEDGANPITGTGPPLSFAMPTQEEGFLEVDDSILAYRFVYPVLSASGKKIPIIFSRRPERYSSAAPLSVDARQRIVTSLTSLQDAITISVSVGPPSGVLAQNPRDSWTAKQVAETVLADRSTSRVTAGQRVALNSVEDAAAEDRDGQTYWVYNHYSQGSPNLLSPERETYRRATAVTAVREGRNDHVPYLYTLNFACPSEIWDDMEPMFRKGIASFRLTQPGDGYTAPDEQSWRFF